MVYFSEIVRKKARSELELIAQESANVEELTISEVYIAESVLMANFILQTNLQNVKEHYYELWSHIGASREMFENYFRFSADVPYFSENYSAMEAVIEHAVLIAIAGGCENLIKQMVKINSTSIRYRGSLSFNKELLEGKHLLLLYQGKDEISRREIDENWEEWLEEGTAAVSTPVWEGIAAVAKGNLRKLEAAMAAMNNERDKKIRILESVKLGSLRSDILPETVLHTPAAALFRIAQKRGWSIKAGVLPHNIMELWSL